MRTRAFRLVSSAFILLHFAACSAKQAALLAPPDVGIVVGEVFVEDPQRTSLGGAIVELPGTSAKVRTEAGKQFVLTAIPVGEHELHITHAASGRALSLKVTVAANQTLQIPPEQTTLKRAATLSGKVSVPTGSPAGTTVFLVGGSGRQVALAGDDGTFALDGLPPGSARMGVWKDGLALQVVAKELKEGENTLDPVTLAAAGAGNLSLQGNVKLADRTDHKGVAVLLNGGEKVASTDENGAFHFDGLTSGHYALTATLAGYQSVELPAVALGADGKAEGLVPVLMTPGSDPDPASIARDRAFSVRIASPASGASFERGEQITFLGDVTILGEEIPPSRQAWTIEGTSPAYAAKPLGTGHLVTANGLATGLHLVTLTATAGDGEKKTAQALVEVKPLSLGLEITSPTANGSVPASAPVALVAGVDVRPGVTLDPANVVWSWRPFGSADAPKELGKGLSTGAVFPAVDAPQLIELTVTASVPALDAVAEAQEVLQLQPFQPQPRIQAAYGGLGLSAPVVRTVKDDQGKLVRLEYEIAQGQPVTLHADVPDGYAVTWQSDTGILFVGPDADLALLSAAEHTFTITVSAAGTGSATTTVKVIVHPFQVTVTITEPVLSPGTPYYAAFGLPLTAKVTHPYQSAFAPGDVRWFDGNHRQIASGLSTRTTLLPPGAGTVTLEVQDAQGHLATGSASYVLQQINFTAAFLQPAEGTDVLEGTAVSARLTWSHSLVPSIIPASRIRVKYLSSIQGVLAQADGKSDFAADEIPSFSGLVAGTHVLTAQVTDGSLTATATRTLTVRSPGVQATLSSPVDGLVVFPGTALTASAAVTHDASVQPLFTWTLDDAEFAANWGTYGTDATNENNRKSISLGTYSATAPPWNDPRWAPGTHRLAFFVRVPGVDPSLGCVNIPNRAVCLRATIQVAPANPDVPTTTIPAGQTVVWSGVKRLTGTVTLAGGTLVVSPGARIVVQPGSVASDRAIQVSAGTLTIGRSDSPDPVVFEVQNSITPNLWDGIRLQPSPASSAVTVTIENTTFRNAAYTLTANSNWPGTTHRVELRDVTFDRVLVGWNDFCPDVAERIRFRHIPQSAYQPGAVNEGNHYNCQATRGYHNLRFEDVNRAISLTNGGDVTIRGNVFQGVIDALTGIGDDLTLAVQDNVFEASTYDNNDAALDLNARGTWTIVRNVFRNNGTGVRLQGSIYGPAPSAPRVVAGNWFERNYLGLNERTNTPRELPVHLNAFTGNVTNILVDRGSSEVTDGADLQAQGNWLGPAGDVTTTGGALFATPAGVLANQPGITDVLDDGSRARLVRPDNPLNAPPALATPIDQILAGGGFPPEPLVLNVPVAFIREPQQSFSYRADCVPLIAESTLANVDVAAQCTWEAAQGSAAFARVFRDADGCLDTAKFPLRSGEWQLRLSCTDPVTSRVDVHRTRFLVDDRTRSGTVWRPQETWSGDVLVDGDVHVPAGRTLTIAAGAKVRFAMSDRLRSVRHPQYAANANYGFGSRQLVDIYVDGLVQVQGTAGAPAQLGSVSGAEMPSQWGGLRIGPGGRVSADQFAASGADALFHGAYRPDDPTNAPQITIHHGTLAGSVAAFKGVCPVEYADVNANHLNYAAIDAHCFQGLVLQNARFDNVDSGGANYGEDVTLQVRPWDANAPASLLLTLDNTFWSRTAGTRDGNVLSVGYTNTSTFALIKVNASTIQNYRGLAVWDASFQRAETFQITDSKLTNFHHLFQNSAVGSHDQVTIDHSTFERGDALIDNEIQRINVTRTTTRSVAEPFQTLNVGGSSITVFSVTGSRFEGSSKVFQVSTGCVTNAQISVLAATGNDFAGTTGAVFTLDPQCITVNPRNITFDSDLRNNYWGASAETAVRTAIADPQADKAAGYKGRTWYAGFLAAPPTLDLLP